MKIFVNGSGLLNKTVIKRLDASGIEINQVMIYTETEKNSFLLYINDLFDIKNEKEVTQYCIANNITLFRANLLFNTAYIGPVYSADNACISCVMEALEKNKSDMDLNLVRYIDRDLYDKYLKENGKYEDLFIKIVSEYIADEVIVSIRQKSELINSIKVFNQSPFNVICHHIEPDEYCPLCSTLGDDTKESAKVKIEDVVKNSPSEYRKNQMPKLDDMKKVLVDKDTGKIKHTFTEFGSQYIPFTGAEVYCKSKIDMGYGRDFDYDISKKSGILEAMERYSGMFNKRTKSKIYGSYNELKDMAVNPREFGLHDREQMKQKGYAYVEYTDDLKYYWVWAWAMNKNKAVLVPEQMAYYAPNLVRNQFDRFVFETSNGCALGSSLAEAFLYGLFEVIERDNFLVAWYNRLPLKEINIAASQIREVTRIKLYMESLGYTLRFYDMSMELNIPAVWGVIINNANKAIVKTYSAAGVHFNPESALKGALLEIVTSISIYEKTYKNKKSQERRERMYRDSSEVTEFEDHVLLYSHPEAEERLSFLLESGEEKKPIQEMYPGWYKDKQYQSNNLKDDIDQLLNKIYKFYDDVYIINSTGRLLSKMNLFSCKVMVPGMNTMSFGHQYRRIIKDRIINGPVWSGRRIYSIADEDINALPHPFP